MLEYEQQAWQQGFQPVAGVDEAGRGPLAGPVVAAAVTLPAEMAEEYLHGKLAGVTDSKKLSAKKRLELLELLQADPTIHTGIGVAEVEEVDRLNILNATHLAMARAVQALDLLPQYALVDGRPVKGLPCPHQAIVQGDAKSLCIASASILAKTHRDHLMERLAESYPEYGFERHKGYGTRVHIERLKKFGPCPAHRRSFRPVQEASGSPRQPQMEFLP